MFHTCIHIRELREDHDPKICCQSKKRYERLIGALFAAFEAL